MNRKDQKAGGGIAAFGWAFVAGAVAVGVNAATRSQQSADVAPRQPDPPPVAAAPPARVTASPQQHRYAPPPPPVQATTARGAAGRADASRTAATVDAYLVWLGQYEAQRVAFSRQTTNYIAQLNEDFQRRMMGMPTQILQRDGNPLGPPPPGVPSVEQQIDARMRAVVAQIRQVAAVASQRTPPPDCAPLHAAYVAAINSQAAEMEATLNETAAMVRGIDAGTVGQGDVDRYEQRKRAERRANPVQAPFRAANRELALVRSRVPGLSAAAMNFMISETS